MIIYWSWRRYTTNQLDKTDSGGTAHICTGSVNYREENYTRTWEKIKSVGTPTSFPVHLPGGLSLLYKKGFLASLCTGSVRKGQPTALNHPVCVYNTAAIASEIDLAFPSSLAPDGATSCNKWRVLTVQFLTVSHFRPGLSKETSSYLQHPFDRVSFRVVH